MYFLFHFMPIDSFGIVHTEPLMQLADLLDNLLHVLNLYYDSGQKYMTANRSQRKFVLFQGDASASNSQMLLLTWEDRVTAASTATHSVDFPFFPKHCCLEGENHDATCLQDSLVKSQTNTDTPSVHQPFSYSSM